ncbi:MAG: hypothetical protein JJV98_05915 [Desulfosarcina sp.]|nr:hypothetical protein [Desulfobacterales bacterium]
MKIRSRKPFMMLGLCLSLVFLTSTAGLAAPVFEITDYISDIEGLTFSFDIGATPGSFEATLSDLSYGPLAFDFLGLSISTATQTLGAIESPGSINFSGTPDITYYANIFGVGAGDFDTGLFGIQIAPVPIPPSLIMLLSGLFLLIVVRRRPFMLDANA